MKLILNIDSKLPSDPIFGAPINSIRWKSFFIKFENFVVQWISNTGNNKAQNVDEVREIQGIVARRCLMLA